MKNLKETLFRVVHRSGEVLEYFSAMDKLADWWGDDLIFDVACQILCADGKWYKFFPIDPGLLEEVREDE